MCSIFPKFAEFQDNRDVIFNLKAPSIDFEFNNDKMRFIADLYSNVVTHNSIDKRDELYIQRADGKNMVI